MREVLTERVRIRPATECTYEESGLFIENLRSRRRDLARRLAKDLSVAVHRGVADAGPLRAARHYNDLAPRWTRLPSKQYRLTAPADGYRPYPQDTVLISSVSPAHRYALEIATLAKAERLDQHVEQRAVRRAAR